MTDGGGPVVPRQNAQEAQLVEGVRLAGLVTDIAVQRQCPGQTGGSGRVASVLPLQYAQRAKRIRLAEPVSRLARCGQRALVEGGGLIPVPASGQEAANRGGYRDGVPGVAAGGGVVRGGVQVRALCFQPGCRLPEGGQVRGLWGRVAGHRAAVRAGLGGEVPAGGQGGVQVVIQHPPGCGDAVCLVVSGSQGAGMFPEQIVQLVPAEGGVSDQVLVIQLIELAAGFAQASAVQRGGSIGVEARSRDQAKPAEQPLLAWTEILVG